MSDFRRFCITAYAVYFVCTTIELIADGWQRRSVDEIVRLAWLMGVFGITVVALFGRKAPPSPTTNEKDQGE